MKYHNVQNKCRVKEIIYAILFLSIYDKLYLSANNILKFTRGFILKEYLI